MAVDLRISQSTCRIVFVYLLHIPYERKSFHDIVIDIEVLVTDAMDKEYVVVLGEDFNLNLDRGYRKQVMKVFGSVFSMNITNRILMRNDQNIWT